MSLRVVGAGLGRTGTHSLQLALQELLDAPCYHMMEVIGHPEHIEIWQRAIEGKPVQWDPVFDGYAAAVDWPAAAFWRELSARSPDALVLLSVRDADKWWKSASSTIFETADRPRPEDPPFGAVHDMVESMLTRCFTPAWREEDAAKAAYEAHNAAVRVAVPADRLVEWHPGDGWEPICAALGVEMPSVPFPHVNTTEDFRLLTGLDTPSP
jgi:hypothetical protein